MTNQTKFDFGDPLKITIFADASFSHNPNAAGWGAWAKRDDWDRGQTYGGEIKRRCNNSYEAELFAIANVVALLRHRGHLESVKVLMVQSDCQRALQVLIDQGLGTLSIANETAALSAVAVGFPISPNERDAAASLRGSLAGIESVTFKHVKGHREGPGRHWVNRECDSIARGHMNTARRRYR